MTTISSSLSRLESRYIRHRPRNLYLRTTQSTHRLQIQAHPLTSPLTQHSSLQLRGLRTHGAVSRVFHPFRLLLLTRRIRPLVGVSTRHGTTVFCSTNTDYQTVSLGYWACTECVACDGYCAELHADSTVTRCSTQPAIEDFSKSGRSYASSQAVETVTRTRTSTEPFTSTLRNRLTVGRQPIRP